MLGSLPLLVSNCYHLGRIKSGAIFSRAVFYYGIFKLGYDLVKTFEPTFARRPGLT
jgi:hypothetical protein